MTVGSGALPYVSITRHFREVTEDPKDGLTRRMLRGFRSVAPTTWRNLLRPDAKEHAPSAVVLVAPSGAGKSTEVEKETERLRREGHVVFCCEAGAVATDGLRASLDRPSAEAFEQWLAGTASAVVFLDAVDEVYLRQRKFRDVTRRLAKEIDFATRDIQIVVTVRNGAWSTADLNDLADLLRPREADPKIKIVTFEPIDAEALGALARAAGVKDVDAFLRRFEEDDLYNLLDLRPCDAHLFVDYWNKHGAFGTWTQILADFLDTSFVEANPVHQSNQELSLEQGSSALRRIAAASILTKRTHVTLPMSASLPGAMDGRKLFADWEGRLLGELFGNGLLVHKGEAAVQLPQGALTHFLAAKWFAERFRKGWRLEELRDALFIKVFDESRWRVPASRHPVVGWVASEVPELRELLLDEDPRALLCEGDPRRLDTSEIVAALRKIFELAVAKKGSPGLPRGRFVSWHGPSWLTPSLGSSASTETFRRCSGISFGTRSLVATRRVWRMRLRSRSTAPPTRHHAPAPSPSSPKSATHRRRRRFSICSRRRASRFARNSFRRSSPTTCAVTRLCNSSFGWMTTSSAISSDV
jgi:hypothetical protein